MDMLNKDIKILREFTESNCCLYSQEEIIEATKNILSELENKNNDIKGLKEDNIHLMEYASDVLKTNDKLAENVETYKKIAEMFGKSLISISGEKTSLEELLDWAKREVLKNE